MHHTDQLLEQFPDLLSGANPGSAFTHLAACDNYAKDSLVFCGDESYVEQLTQSPPAAIITSQELAERLIPVATVLTSANPRLAHALVKQAIDDFDASDPEWPAVHPSAIIHDTAKMGKDCRIGPNVVIGANTQIGDNCIIRANSVIEHDVTIGNDCVIHPLSNIGHSCILGHRVILRPGVIIGNEGFGLVPDDNKRYHRVPHTGRVVIHDDVQIGTHCNIDRGTYGDTILERGVKIDAFCHIAHNVVIGADTLFVAQCGIAGSATIGERVILSGQTGVIDHMHVAADSVLVHRAGVTEDVKEAGVWGGLPLRPFKEHVKRLNLDKHVLKLQRRIEALEKKLADKA